MVAANMQRVYTCLYVHILHTTRHDTTLHYTMVTTLHYSHTQEVSLLAAAEQSHLALGHLYTTQVLRWQVLLGQD